MNIVINNIPVDVLEGETLLECAKRIGYKIPSLCYSKGAKHKSSCMVCAVKNCVSGQIIPSCTTLPTEGMILDTEGEEVQLVRTLSLELLLSDHRADCDAPCSTVCPYGLDIERMIWYYDNNNYKQAHAMLSQVFKLTELGCDSCKAPCEKICRRKSIDKAVSIREIIKELANMENNQVLQAIENNVKSDSKAYQSLLGRFSADEKIFLKEKVASKSRCLHCACLGKKYCKLRIYATGSNIKRSRYNIQSELPVMEKIYVRDNIWFEPAKCIRCGLCVYNSENGFTFKDRGFGMQVALPKENKLNIKDTIVDICPTGALYTIDI